MPDLCQYKTIRLLYFDKLKLHDISIKNCMYDQ